MLINEFVSISLAHRSKVIVYEIRAEIHHATILKKRENCDNWILCKRLPRINRYLCFNDKLTLCYGDYRVSERSEHMDQDEKRSENADKSERGKNRMDALDQRFSELVFEKKIRKFEKKKRFTRPGFQPDQFYAPFEIEFEDDSKWEIFSSTSYRSDREKGNQWDAFNIKQIDESVEKCFLVVFPENDDQRKLVRRTNEELNQKYSSIDEIIDDSDFFDFLERKSYESRSKTAGQINDEKGRAFEKRVVSALRNKGNLLRWKGSPLQSGLDYDLIFVPVLDAFRFEAHEVASIDATDDIPKLPTGGSPKTDVSVTIELCNGQSVTKNISCKTSSKKRVTVHQYSVDEFLRVLAVEDKRFKEALIRLQECGGTNNLESDYGEDEVAYLSENFGKYNESLAKWVLGGHGGEVSSPDVQLAHYFLVRSESGNFVNVYGLEDYVSKMIDPKNYLQMNTPFQWTYASGCKGKSIQLKARIEA